MNSLYLLLLAVLVLFSWVGSIYGLTLPDGTMLPNLLSEESVRWFVRHSIGNIAAAPFVEILLVLIMIGALQSSGLLSATLRCMPNTGRHRYALRTAVAIFVVGVVLLVVNIAPGGNLLSVTGHVAKGPFAQGWLFLLTIIIGIPCIVYGCMSGQWRNERDVLVGLSSEIVRCADCLVTCIVASQLVATMRYIRLFDLMGSTQVLATLTEVLVYALPFVLRWCAVISARRIS